MIWLPGVLSQGKKYIWARYTISSAETEGTPGTLTVSGGASFYASTSYKVSGQTFSLVDPVSKSGYLLDAGMYIFADGGTSGTTLLEITNNTGGGGVYNVSYIPHTFSDAPGSYIDTVTDTNANAYPENGKQGNYWYVRIEAGDEPDVPSGVNYVDYLQSTGTQCLDTAYVPNANTRVEMTFQLTTPDNTNQAIFGVAGQFSFRWYGTSGYFRSNGSNNANFSTSIDSSAKHTVVKTATKTTIDDTYNVNTNAATITLSLYLFGQHVSTGLQNPAKVKIFGCKIYEGNVLVHDYRPCLDPDGVACMYDEVNTEYVYNAGSGTFAYGMAA